MEKPKIIKVSDENLVSVVETLAHSIWREYFVPIIGSPQVEYMLEKFQSRQAILNQIEKDGFLYYLLEDKTGNRVGYFAVVPRQEELFLSKLYITAENRRKGFGRCALEFIETLAKDIRLQPASPKTTRQGGRDLAKRREGLSKIILTVNKNNTASINA